MQKNIAFLDEDFSETSYTTLVKPEQKQPLFLCSCCGNLLAYKGYLTKSQESFSMFKAIFNYQILDEFASEIPAMTLQCNICENELGFKLKQHFLLYKPMVKYQPNSAKIALLGLKLQQLQDFAVVLKKISGFLELSLEIDEIQLTKSTLKGFHLKENAYNSAILLHKQEGRLLLIGENGFYNDLVFDAIKSTQGNFLLILTNLDETPENTEKKAPRIKEILCNVKKIDVLAREGGQPFLSTLANQLMLLTLEEERAMNHEQTDFLCSFLHKSLYKSMIPQSFREFREDLQGNFESFDTKKLRFGLFQEIEKEDWVKNEQKVAEFVRGEREKCQENAGFCRVF